MAEIALDSARASANSAREQELTASGDSNEAQAADSTQCDRSQPKYVGLESVGEDQRCGLQVANAGGTER